ncbi:hypothetical protein [Rhizobium sp. Root482]|uniref:hypothetical protein n=1 Tax=Rhizobium sp. Root482 TaxID=1736543 RepID=UPI0006FC0D82|nr:hypothetical protein [Rhizobium sp. Root482]KQY12329.1 hypothetical protein ASD31_17380 [Rhizobium sp. Root482]
MVEDFLEPDYRAAANFTVESGFSSLTSQVSSALVVQRPIFGVFAKFLRPVCSASAVSADGHNCVAFLDGQSAVMCHALRRIAKVSISLSAALETN